MMATQEEIDAGAEALAQWNAPNISLKERGPEQQAVLRKEAALVLEAAERVRQAVIFQHVGADGTTYHCEVNGPANIIVEKRGPGVHFRVADESDLLIREDRPE